MGTWGQPQEADITVVDEVNRLVYAFVDEGSHERWALTDEPTWHSARPATDQELVEARTTTLQEKSRA